MAESGAAGSAKPNSEAFRADEQRAAIFLRGLGLEPEAFPNVRGEERGQTPDFKVMKGERLALYCEVKSIFTETKPDVGLLWRTLYNSLTTDVHTAVKQFAAVNPNHAVPNVLIWLSHNFQINIHSFLDLLQGKIQIEDLEVANLGKYSQGRFKQDIASIDLVVWLGLDGDDNASMVLLTQSPAHKASLIADIPALAEMLRSNAKRSTGSVDNP